MNKLEIKDRLNKKEAAPEVEAREQINKIRKLTTILIILAILTSCANLLSIKHYNQLIEKQKAFIEEGERILSKIEKNIILKDH